ncbi:MAG: aminomethyl-transferring glycine dehydrogenase, partial [Thermoplasmata archaeon]
MSDVQDMLKFLKINNIDDLFMDIPKEARIDRIDIPDGITEQELIAQANAILNRNKTAKEMPMFIGAGIYNHYIPAAVAALVSRSEFYTAYTPYQPEISQGMLQTLFEYQSYIAELTEMDVANASMYDFATALGEAARMANAINMKKEILIPKNILEEKKKVLQVYLYGLGVKIVEYPYEPATG